MRRLQSFRAFLDLKFYLLAFLEGLVPIHFDGGEMREYIIATVVWRDEPISLTGVEPLHNSGCHNSIPLIAAEPDRVPQYSLRTAEIPAFAGESRGISVTDNRSMLLDLVHKSRMEPTDLATGTACTNRGQNPCHVMRLPVFA